MISADGSLLIMDGAFETPIKIGRSLHGEVDTDAAHDSLN
jgi:hypothetical protein